MDKDQVSEGEELENFRNLRDELKKQKDDIFKVFYLFQILEKKRVKRQN